jgi:hypothetical protein
MKNFLKRIFEEQVTPSENFNAAKFKIVFDILDYEEIEPDIRKERKDSLVK